MLLVGAALVLGLGVLIVVAVVLRRRVHDAPSQVQGENFSLEELDRLRDAGHLSRAEYDHARRSILGEQPVPAGAESIGPDDTDRAAEGASEPDEGESSDEEGPSSEEKNREHPPET